MSGYKKERQQDYGWSGAIGAILISAIFLS